MRLSGAFRLAARSIARNKLRSLLMMLGVAVGIGALTGVWSIGVTTRRVALEMMKRSVGSYDTLIIHPGAGRTNSLRALVASASALSLDDFRALNASLPGIKRAVAVQSLPSATVKFRDREAAPSLYGVSEHWSAVRGDQFAAGGPITAADIDASARVVVLGADVKRTLFGDADAVGSTIRIADIPFEVKGVLVPMGAGLGPMDNRDIKVYIPISTSARRVANNNYLALILVQMTDPLQSAIAVQSVTTLFRQRHGIVPPASDDFSVITPRAAVVRVSDADAALTKVLTGVAAVSILVGGVVIMTLMLVAVSQRRVEIGVRRSIGATRRDVLIQFLVESFVVSLAGGALGMAAGVLIIALAKQIGGLPVMPDWQVMAAVTGTAAAVGLVFGVHPAWRASTVDPIAALRS